MRWLKRIGIALGVLLSILLIAALFVSYRASRVPDWYAQARSGPREAHRRSEDKLFLVQNWATQTATGRVDSKPEVQKRYTTVEFTSDDINDLIAEWVGAQGVKEKVETHVKDLRVRINDGTIVIAGESTEYQRVISVVLRPGMGADGYATLSLDSIRVGEMAMPLVALGSQQKKLSGSLAALSAKQRERLGIDERGVATSATVNLYYTALITDLLSGKTPAAYTFVNNTVATRIGAFHISGGKLKVTLEILSPEQRAAFLQELRHRTTP